MKHYFNKFCVFFTIVSLIFFLIAVIIHNRLNIQVPFIRLSFGAILISLFISLSHTIFKLHKGNSLVNAILGFIVLLPVIYICKRVFGVLVFRFSFIIYLFAIICAIIYGIAVFIVSRKAKKDEQYLNTLLNKSKNNSN